MEALHVVNALLWKPGEETRKIHLKKVVAGHVSEVIMLETCPFAERRGHGLSTSI